MASSPIAWSSFHACRSSAVKVGGLSGSSRYVTSPVVSLFIAIRPSCGDQADPLPALCIDHKKNRLFDAPQDGPPFLAVVAGNVQTFKPAAILEDLAGQQKGNLVLAPGTTRTPRHLAPANSPSPFIVAFSPGLRSPDFLGSRRSPTPITEYHKYTYKCSYGAKFWRWITDVQPVVHFLRNHPTGWSGALPSAAQKARYSSTAARKFDSR